MRFVLVHGGFHGAWCWERVVRELEALGHEPVALDLPGHGERRDEPATNQAYAESVVEVMQPGDTLVGHSMGGKVITLAADARLEWVHRLVYLAATVPVNGDTTLGMTPSNGRAIGDLIEVRDGFVHPMGRDGIVDHFYHDCTPEDAAWAWSRLTPEPAGPLTEAITLRRLWKERPAVSYIHCTADRAHPKQAYDAALSILDVKPVPLEASHSPFISRPAELAGVLDELGRMA